jgi:hypothetical protein
MYASSSWISPFPLCYLGTYKRSTCGLGWCCPWMVSSFLVFVSNFHSFFWCQLIIPKLYLSTGTASDPVACILFSALNSVFKINLISSSIPSLTFLSRSDVPCNDSSTPKYLYAFLGPSSVMSFSYVTHFSSPKVILISLLIVFSICI